MGGEGGEDGAEPEFMDYLMHFLSFNWKVLHAFIPPTDMGGGWYTFWVSLAFIGGITVFVGDMAKMLGCCIGLDAAITNVTGSNSVNVFLGLGLPWTAAAFYHIGNGTTYKYPAGDLVFSVLVFFAFAFACIGLLLVRRQFCGGELGGPKKIAYASSTTLACLWLAYIIVSAMKTKGKI